MRGRRIPFALQVILRIGAACALAAVAWGIACSLTGLRDRTSSEESTMLSAYSINDAQFSFQGPNDRSSRSLMRLAL